MEDVTDVVPGQRFEHYDLIDSVEELRPDDGLEFIDHLVPALVEHVPATGDGLHLLCRVGTRQSD